MSVSMRLTGLSLILLLFGEFSPAQEIPEAQQIANWPSPLLWVPTEVRAPGEARTEAANTASAPLPLIAISPCRILDTRGNGAPIQGGIFTGGSDVRNYVLAGI